MYKRLFHRMLATTLCLVMLCLPMSQALAADNEENPYKAIRDAVYKISVGDYDPTYVRLQGLLSARNDTAQTLWDAMNPNPVSHAVKGSYLNQTDPQYADDWLFPDRPLGDRTSNVNESDHIQVTFQNLKSMALAYQSKGCELYHNADLLAAIKSAVEFLYTNHFNPDIPSYDNWYTWQLGVPLNFGELLLILYDCYTEQEIKTYASMLTYYLGTRVMTGANEAWCERVRLYAGILLEDSTWLQLVQTNLPALLTYTTKGDGYYTDGGFIQHDSIAYNGGYGASALRDMVYLFALLNGSPWEITTRRTRLLYDWVQDSYEPIVYNGLGMDTFRGREITRKSSSQAVTGRVIAKSMLMLAEMVDEEKALHLKGVVKGWFENDYMLDVLDDLDMAAQVYDLLADDSIPAIHAENGTTQMNSIARTVHRAEDWALAISMTSKRIQSAELYGTDNAHGWYIGNGATWLYNTDVTRYEKVYKPTLDWYRIPGATAVYGKGQGGTKNLNSFTGGVENGLYGVSGMDFAVNTNNLKMKKSWFMFDNEVVYIGSGISGTGTVETTLENLMLEENNRAFTVNGTSNRISLNGNALLYRDTRTLHIGGNVTGSDIGFYFPEAADLNIKSETRTGTWKSVGSSNTDTSTQSADYLTVWQSHGSSPTDEGYAYVLLPGMSAAETESYAADSNIEILQQDNAIHAVHEKTTGAWGACFWTPGTLAVSDSDKFLTVDHSAAVLVQEDADGVTVTLSDPTQEITDDVILELDRSVKGIIKLDRGVELLQSSPTVKLKFSVQDTAGESLNARLAYSEVALPDIPQAVQSVISAIDAIGTVSYKSKTAIQAAREAYDALKPEEQAQVTNAEDLFNAEYDFEDILEIFSNTMNVIKWKDFTVNQLNTASGAAANTKTLWMAGEKLTEEQKQATVDAFKDEIIWQYENGNHIGADGGDYINNQYGHLVIQTESLPNDNVGSPWGMSRHWAFVCSPFAGIAFSVCGYFSCKTDRNLMPLGDDFVYEGNRYQVFWYAQKRHADAEKVPGSMNGVTVSNITLSDGKTLAFPGGINATDVTNNTFRYAYALYSQKYKKQNLTIGFTTENAVDADGYVYQTFVGPQGNAYLINTDERIAAADTSADGQDSVIAQKAFVIVGELAAAWDALGGDVASRVAVTGMPLGDANDGVQLFENGRLTAKGFTPYGEEEPEPPELFTLTISDGAISEGENGRCNITWNAQVKINDGVTLDEINEKAEFKSYGVIYGISQQAVDELAVGEDNSNAKTKYFAKADGDQTDIDVYTIFGFRLKNVGADKLRAARFFIQFEYEGHTFTVFSPTEAVNTPQTLS